MPDPALDTVECPFCKEAVKAGAMRCKHCQSAIPLAIPSRQGVCPYCKEQIRAGAVRCKHCKVGLRRTATATLRVPRDLGAAPVGSDRLRAPQRSIGRPDLPPTTISAAPQGCNDFEIDEDGTIWVFDHDDADTCYYTLDPREYL